LGSFDGRILTVLHPFLASYTRRHISLTPSEPYTEVVSLPFSLLKHLCRFEKGGYCKKIKGACKPQNCPEILKGE
jgi:hypothetical protein